MKTQSAQSRKREVRQAARQASIGEQDWLKAMAAWLVLEGFCLGIAPSWGWIEPGDRLQFWLSISIPAGILGALILAFSSQGVQYINAQKTSLSKRTQIVIIQVLGGVGLVGILLPLLILFMEFIAKASVEILQRPS